jgi:hypothetical protein
MSNSVSDTDINQLFTQARTYSSWLDKPVDGALPIEPRVR